MHWIFILLIIFSILAAFYWMGSNESKLIAKREKYLNEFNKFKSKLEKKR